MCPTHNNNIAPANHVQKLSPCENDRRSSCQNCPWNRPNCIQAMGLIQRPQFQCNACAISLKHSSMWRPTSWWGSLHATRWTLVLESSCPAAPTQIGISHSYTVINSHKNVFPSQTIACPWQVPYTFFSYSLSNIRYVVPRIPPSAFPHRFYFTMEPTLQCAKAT